MVCWLSSNVIDNTQRRDASIKGIRHLNGSKFTPEPVFVLLWFAGHHLVSDCQQRLYDSQRG